VKLEKENIKADKRIIFNLIDIVQERLRSLNDIVPMMGFFFKEPKTQAARKSLENFDPTCFDKLKKLIEQIDEIKTWEEKEIEKRLEE